MPENEKDDLLVDFLSESGERCRVELLQRFQRENMVAASHGAIERRTVKDLLTTARVRADQRARQLSAKRAADAARKKAKVEADRAVFLDQLAKREDSVWKHVEWYIQKRQPKDYDRAVILLADMRDLAVRQGRESGFQSALEKIRKTHVAKETFLRRLTMAKL